MPVESFPSFSASMPWGEDYQIIREFVRDPEANGGLAALQDNGLEMLQALLDRVDSLQAQIEMRPRAGDGTRRLPALGTSESIGLDTIFPKTEEAVPLLLTCPLCGFRHVDEGEMATRLHHTHECYSCGMTWRPAMVSTVGVRHLPGFRNG